MGVKIDETTVYAFRLWVSAADTASALSGSAAEAGSVVAESSNSGVTMVAAGDRSYSRSKTGRNGMGVGRQ